MIIESTYHFIRFIAETKADEEYIKTMTLEEKAAAMKLMDDVVGTKRIKI